jgi:hypothetical protein
VPVRSLGAYTAQVDELVRWLKESGKTVAMKSTGVYRIPLYQKLEEGAPFYFFRRYLPVLLFLNS